MYNQIDFRKERVLSEYGFPKSFVRAVNGMKIILYPTH